MKLKESYTCCRCGFKTHDKTGMRRHLFDLKKECPGIVADIPLTDDIKNSILRNRIYHVPKELPPPPVCNIMNNFNTINHYVSNLDTIHKLTKIMDYNKNELIAIDESIERNYLPKCKRLENSKRYNQGFQFKKQDLLEIIDDVCRVCNGKGLEEFNILYDSKSDKLSFYGIDQEKCWKDLLVSSGIKKIVELIQENYLNSYECYLARRLMDENEKMYNKQVCKEHLEEYYKFIGCFDVLPYVKDHYDNEIMYGNDDDEYYKGNNETRIQDELYPMYKKVIDKTTKCDINSTKKEVLNLIKKNTQKNIGDLNNKVVQLFKMDEDFKSVILKDLKF